MKHYFPLIFCALGLAILPSLSRAQMDRVGATELRGTRGKHHYKLRFVTGPFLKAQHKIEGTGANTRIDGKLPWGTDGGIPLREFRSFEVTVDGRKWNIPKRLWADCYEPNLHNQRFRKIWTTLSRDGQKLAMGMQASDGAGSYYVIWYLRADGHNSREFRPLE